MDAPPVVGGQRGKGDGGVTAGAGRLELLQKSSGSQQHTKIPGGLIHWMPTTSNSETNVLVFK